MASRTLLAVIFFTATEISLSAGDFANVVMGACAKETLIYTEQQSVPALPPEPPRAQTDKATKKRASAKTPALI